MRGDIARVLRVLLMLMMALFVARFSWGSSAADHAQAGNAAAQAAPARPPQRQVPAAKPQPAVPAAEGADAAQTPEEAQRQEQLQKQLINIRQQIEQDAINRMQSGGSNYNAFNNFMSDFIPFLVFLGVTGAILWILRQIFETRRWNKMVKVQTETHAKLLDRFSSSQEMLAYMQSDAGKKFLEAPIFEGQRRQVSTLPFGRILWSVQVGVVAIFVGAGFLFLRGKVTPDADMGFQIFGTLLLTLGLGFLVSGGVSYVLAKYFGLLEQHDTLTRPEHSA